MKLLGVAIFPLFPLRMGCLLRVGFSGVIYDLGVLW